MFDVRWLSTAVRAVTCRPTATVASIVTLAVSLGGLTTVFAILDAAVLTPLPYPDQDRVVILTHTTRRPAGISAVSAPNFEDWVSNSRSFEALTGIVGRRLPVTGVPFPEQLDIGYVSAGFFQVFGVAPAVGRPFLAEEDRPENSQVAVITDGLWARQFGRALDAIGRTILVDGKGATIVAVMSREFRLLGLTPDVFVPLGFDQGLLRDRAAQRLIVVGRLAPHATVQTAQVEMSAIAAQLERAYPKENEGLGARVQRYADFAGAWYRPRLWIVFGTVGVVLLVACLNLANLQLARLHDRHRELAVRLALGATPFRLLCEFTAQMATLVLVGAAAGLGLTAAAIRLVSHVAPPALSTIRAPKIDLRSFAVMLAAMAFAILVSSLASAVASMRLDPVLSLRANANARSRQRLRRLLVMTQTAMSVILLVAAGLLLRNLIERAHTDLGFDASHKVTVRIDLPRPTYQPAALRIEALGAALSELGKLPGVTSVAAANYVPFDRYSFQTFLSVEGAPEGPFAKSPEVQFRTVTTNYFEAMGIPVSRGRAFSSGDDAGAVAVAIINEKLRQHLFGDEPGIGRRIHLRVWNPSGTRKGDVLEKSVDIVGVVGNTREQIDMDPRSIVYLPYAQHPDSTITFVIGFSGASRPGVEKIQMAITGGDERLALAHVDTFSEAMGRDMLEPRFFSGVLSTLAAIALLLATVGLYGVVAGSVIERSRELAVRLAIGAQQRNVVWLVLRDGGQMAIVGLLAGLVGSLALPRLVSAFIGAAEWRSVPVLLIVAVLLLGVAVLAMMVPIRRAVRVDPAKILRAE